MSGPIAVTNDEIEGLSMAFQSAAIRMREMLGALTPSAVAVGPGLGSGKSAAAYAGQWDRIRASISGAADALEMYGKALNVTNQAYSQTDSRMTGKPQ